MAFLYLKIFCKIFFIASLKRKLTFNSLSPRHIFKGAKKQPMVFSVNKIFKNPKKILGHQAHDEFFVEKNHENPLTHYVIRANFVSNFGILKIVTDCG